MSANLGECSDPENFVSEHVEEIEYDFDTFDNFEKKIKKFEQQLQKFEQDSKDSFYLAILYTTFDALLEKKEDFESCQDKGKLTRVLGQKFFEELAGKRESLQLDLSLLTFQPQCHLVNNLLMTKILFLRVYEPRKKCRYPIKKVPKTKNVVKKDLSACVEEHFDGFEIVRKLTEDQSKENFQPFYIVTSLLQK